MFDQFPKIRPHLPPEIEEIYAIWYKSNRSGQSAASAISQKTEGWMHAQVARDVGANGGSNAATLEIGAGPLNQLDYEGSTQPYDIVEPFSEAYRDSPLLPRVRNIYSDIEEVPKDTRYQRITSVATLEHICNLPDVVARAGLLLASDGTFRASIPSEGTLLWKLGWKLTTGLEFKLKYGLDYGLLMANEHVNTAKEIEQVLEYFFENVSSRILGIAKSLSFYQYYECTDPIVQRCVDFERMRADNLQQA